VTPDIYAEWLRRQGQRVLRTASSYWHSGELGVYQAFPYHWLIEPSDTEVGGLFSEHRAIALRYSQPPASVTGCPSYAIVFADSAYGMDSLTTHTRNNVRRGLKNCVVEPISFQRLVEQAWELRCDALDRQGRNLKLTYESWKKRYLSASDYAGFEAWAAMAGDRLAGYLVTFQMDDCLCIIDHQSHREFLKYKINNALTFTVSRNGMTKPGVKILFYGVESLDAPARVSEFKFHMGYAARPIRQRVVFRPAVAPLANRLTYGLVSTLSRWFPADRRFAKAKGMLRLSLNDARPLPPEVFEDSGSQPAKPSVTR
jgi:hypothetical protein